MMNFLRKHMRKIFIVTIIAFVGGTFMGFGAYLFGPAKDFDIAVTVNGTKIPVKIFSSLYNSTADMYRNSTKESPSQEQLEAMRIKTVQSLVQDEIFYQQAQQYKITVSDAELKNDIQSMSMFRNRQNQFDPNIYYAFLNSIRLSPKEYETLRKKQIAGEKVKITMASAVKISDSEYEAAAAGGSEISRDEMMQIKVNGILNVWFMNIVKNAKIITNDNIFKQT
ncbi:MAG: SurA N-terminal domain-containing protein [Endomicrobia bacterium]|nr:SurA N-terminal domain-containing protein [Endomicrobiia bacterium]